MTSADQLGIKGKNVNAASSVFFLSTQNPSVFQVVSLPAGQTPNFISGGSPLNCERAV